MEPVIKNIVLLRGLVSWGGFALFLISELISPYRKPSVSKAARLMTNVSLTLLNSIFLSLVFAAPTISIASWVAANRVGVLNMLSMPLWLKVSLAVLFLDFMLYIWHLLNHEMPLFWRFHRVHHSDLNMDVSTATRFHAGELSISAVIKIGLIYFIGADLVSVIIFESLLVLTAQFQHSSLRVPAWFENVFWLLFVPPSMHRIHHSVVISERDTNYGTILSIWDRMLGTLLKDVDQERIIIGVGPYREPQKLTLRHLLLMPFTRTIK
ncbi:MAG: sterol desaturase family protein [Nitrospirae bacterium]|nr:MAG: sterol desaturase family protein [Nitrospirota bacterium]